jgi:DNA repair protein RadA/Sms
MEGTRPILVEIQALATDSAFGLPRRSANGLDNSRLQLLVAVLQKRVGLNLGQQDIYANVVGGLRVLEPAVDLGVAIAIASSFRDEPVDPKLVGVGEIGLSGELRSVNQLDRRIMEAHRLGFKRIIVPRHSGKAATRLNGEVEIIPAGSAVEAIGHALGF